MESKGQARETLKWTREHRLELAFPILRKIFFFGWGMTLQYSVTKLVSQSKVSKRRHCSRFWGLRAGTHLDHHRENIVKGFPIYKFVFFGVIFLVYCHLYPRCQAVIKKNRIHSKNMHRYLLRLIFSLIIKLYICVIDCLIMRKTSEDKETSVYELDNCHAQEKKIESFLLSLLVMREAKKLERVTVSF